MVKLDEIQRMEKIRSELEKCEKNIEMYENKKKELEDKLNQEKLIILNKKLEEYNIDFERFINSRIVTGGLD